MLKQESPKYAKIIKIVIFGSLESPKVFSIKSWTFSDTTLSIFSNFGLFFIHPGIWLDSIGALSSFKYISKLVSSALSSLIASSYCFIILCK